MVYESLVEEETECDFLERDRIRDLKIYETVFKPQHRDVYPQLIQLRDCYKYFDDLFQHFDIYTTRFNSYTFQENKRYKENVLGGFEGSLYSTTMPLPVSAPLDKYLFVLEMNNTLNRIMGIGFIKNILANDQSAWVYDNPGFNNYIYKSKFYVSMEDERMEDTWKKFIEDEFERTLFYGKSNLKRGSSFTRLPIKRMKFNHLKFLLSIFIILNPGDFNDIVKL